MMIKKQKGEVMEKLFLVLLMIIVLVAAFLEPVEKDIPPIVEVVEVDEVVKVVEIGWYDSTTNGKWEKVTGLNIPIYVFQSLSLKKK